MEKKKILVVDDEEDLCEILQFNLKSAGYLVDVSYSAEEAFARLKNNYDLLLLDVMMGGISGFKLAELIRTEYNNSVPIIFITARDNVADKLKGFNVGADDYIAKPFSIKEVVARVQAVLSRTAFYKKSELEKIEYEKRVKEQKKSEQGIISFPEFSINTRNKQISLYGESIKLTKKEFEILLMLATSPLKIFSRADILDAVWQNEAYVLDRTVDVHIARLRKKIGTFGACIVNRSGYGYCFDIDEVTKD
ncbi:MAG: response regulator transcription factor [Bacteroidales bacterium]|jgi:two-component system alkaline phosphatase synthesis response regulator PhoP